jgi:hypothetical protein
MERYCKKVNQHLLEYKVTTGLSLHIGQVRSISDWLNLLFSVCSMYVPVSILAFVMAFLTSLTELLIESQTINIIHATQ